MSEEIKRLDRKLVAKGAIIDYYQDTMQIPNGHVATWDFIKHKGAAAVVAVRPDGKLLMVRQYRNALERETLEIPAGGLNGADEPTDLAAMRAGGGDRLSNGSCRAAFKHPYHGGILQ